MILLDTHVLVWLDEGNSRLGADTLLHINSALASGTLAVSAISFWEIAMLVRKNRLEMQLDPGIWRNDLLNSGLREIPMDGAIGIRAAELSRFHGDPADRIIVATALQIAATLVTADQKILGWGELPLKMNPRY